MPLSLFTTFRGRIGRQTFWIGFLIVTITSVAGELYLDPDALKDDTSLAVSPVSATLWSSFWLIPATAIAVKRFNDRDWPSWVGYALSAFWLFTFVGPHFGLFIDPNAGVLGAIAFWLLILSALAALIDNGFMKGTPGPNRYGPEPMTDHAPVPAV